MMTTQVLSSYRPPPPPPTSQGVKSPSCIRKFPGELPSLIQCTPKTKELSVRSSHPRRRVDFSPIVKVKDTLSHRDMSLKEHYAYWLQDHEFHFIRLRNQRLVMLAEESNSQQKKTQEVRRDQSAQTKSIENDDENCIRGLESLSKCENLRRKSYRIAALEEVFFEQEQQYYGGYYDDEAIAEAYYEVTGECRFRAEYMGMQDRKEIEDYIKDDLPLTDEVVLCETCDTDSGEDMSVEF